MIMHSVYAILTAAILITPSNTQAQKRHDNFFRAPTMHSGAPRQAMPQSRARVPAISSGSGNLSLTTRTPILPDQLRLLKYEQERQRAHTIHRSISKRVVFAGGVLLLPAVSYFGVPVVLDVPQVGEVLVAEQIYAEIYELLLSENEQAIARAIAWLSQVKQEQAFEINDGPKIIRAVPSAPSSNDPEARDYSEPISFDSPKKPSKGRARNRLY